jgi:hypothetical protein
LNRLFSANEDNIAYDGTYSLETGKTISIYLSKGTKLNLTANDKAFNTALKYTGQEV